MPGFPDGESLETVGRPRCGTWYLSSRKMHEERFSRQLVVVVAGGAD